MTVLSIIVPTYNEQQTIEPFLDKLLLRLKRMPFTEVIVVDSSDDKTYKNASSVVGVMCVRSSKGRAKQMNLGASLASGQYLLFVHCDTQLPEALERWWQEVLRQRPQWGFFKVNLSGKGWRFRMIESAMNIRSRWSAIGTGDQCLFMERRAWLQLEGYKELPIMEDVDLSLRLRELGAPMIYTDPVVTSSRRWEKNGVFRTIGLMWFLRFMYWLGVNPSTLAKFYL